MLYLVLHVLDQSAVMGWLLLVMLFLIFCVALVIRYHGGKWKNIRVIETGLQSFIDG